MKNLTPTWPQTYAVNEYVDDISKVNLQAQFYDIIYGTFLHKIIQTIT